MKEKPTSLKPFHESIVDIIEQCTSADLPLLSVIIKSTKIPNNHDVIADALSKKAALFGEDYLNLVNSVIAQKTGDIRIYMDDAENLEQALEFGFEFMPLGSRYLGPQGEILLLRNCLVKGSSQVAEIAVMDAKANDRRVLFCACWGEKDEIYRIQENWHENIKDWSDKW